MHFSGAGLIGDLRIARSQDLHRNSRDTAQLTIAQSCRSVVRATLANEVRLPRFESETLRQLDVPNQQTLVAFQEFGFEHGTRANATIAGGRAHSGCLLGRNNDFLVCNGGAVDAQDGSYCLSDWVA
jgi:hypothetical protein